jgi:hypothetical protein
VKRPLAAKIQAKLAIYRPSPRAVFFESAWGLSAEPSASPFSMTPAAVMSRMDHGQQRNRDAALWGNLVITCARLGDRSHPALRGFSACSMTVPGGGKRRDVVIRPGSLASS